MDFAQLKLDDFELKTFKEVEVILKKLLVLILLTQIFIMHRHVIICVSMDILIIQMQHTML